MPLAQGLVQHDAGRRRQVQAPHVARRHGDADQALREAVASRTAKLPALAESNIAWNHGFVVTSLVTGALKLDNVASRVFARAGFNVPGLSSWALARRVAR